MKKYFFPLSLLVLFFLSACSSPRVPETLKDIPSPIPTSIPNLFGSNVKKEYFTGGKLRSEFIMSDKTERNGLLKKYGYNGKLTSTVTIRNGAKNGAETLFDAKGRVLKKTPYINGRKEGILEAYYPNGDIMATITYINNVRQGKATKYNRDGSINQQVQFHNGRVTN